MRGTSSSWIIGLAAVAALAGGCGTASRAVGTATRATTGAVTGTANAVAGATGAVATGAAGAVTGVAAGTAGAVSGVASGTAGAVTGVAGAVTGAVAGPLVARVYRIDPATGGPDMRSEVGTVRFTQGRAGVEVSAQFTGISVAGQEAMQTSDGQGVFYPHGLHVHAGSACGPDTVNGKMVPAGAAGPHFDPTASGKHLGPQGMGHAGDLPNLRVLNDGTGTLVASTSRFTLDQIAGRTVVLHAMSDNYTDQPANGGSGARIACGVIQPAAR